MYVKPAEKLINGVPLKVRDPASRRVLPAEGADVPDNSFWIRRLRSGDVVICAPPVAVEPDPVVVDLQIPDSTSSQGEG